MALWRTAAARVARYSRRPACAPFVPPGASTRAVGGAPTKYPILFGCLIWNDKLWLFAYPADPNKNPWKQWYCTKAIPKNNSSYVQKYPFVPYIGTWCDSSNKQSGGFNTGYNEFTFWDKSYISKVVKISQDGVNPYDNPDEFLSLLF
jgi:hypothetical protein